MNVDGGSVWVTAMMGLFTSGERILFGQFLVLNMVALAVSLIVRFLRKEKRIYISGWADDLMIAGLAGLAIGTIGVEAHRGALDNVLAIVDFSNVESGLLRQRLVAGLVLGFVVLVAASVVGAVVVAGRHHVSRFKWALYALLLNVTALIVLRLGASDQAAPRSRPTH